MNRQQLKTTCNFHRLELFLQGGLNSSDTEILELHLTECESCARQIQLNAEQGVSWNEAQSLLAPDEYDSPQHIAAISSLLSDEHDPMTKHQTADVLSREIRGWLDPTDDPRSMGRFAGYEIVGIVGHGGMGIVLKGFEASLNRYVAIKILAPRLATNGSARKRFAREAQAAAAVRHDNVIAIHRVDEWHSLPFLVMPYAGGISLQKRIDSDGPLSIEQTLRVGVQIASGLAAAHAQGLIHRDIKPANILLEQGVERVTITDFGLARAADDASVTRTGVIAGTPQYMSPEQAEAKQLDARSDLFSLGSVMYAMYAGHAPFRAESSYSVLRLITDKEPRPIREINPDVPEWLCAIISKLMAKQAEDRFATAQKVADLLEDCLAHVQQPTAIELPGNLMKHLMPKSASSRPARLMQQFKRLGIRAWLFAGLSVTAIMLIAMMLQDNVPQLSGQGESGPLTAAHANLSELLKQQKSREESIRQISYQGTVRQYAQQQVQRTSTESVDEFVARCVGLVPVYDEVSPYALSASRDFSSGVYRFTMGDINAGIPKDIKYMDWFIDKKKYVQLMGREPGACEAVVTNKREEIRDDREASIVRLDIAAFRPVKDILMSEVLTKAISEPGIPDVGGRPLWKLEPLNSKVGWKATFMFQQPIANPPGARQIHWYRVYWEQIGGELVIVRVDKLTVDGDENSTPQSVVLIDDYRSFCDKPVPFRIRFFGLEDASLYGAELLVSNLKINDYVDLPDDMPIPHGTRVRNLITGETFRQPANKANDPTTDVAQIQGTWNVLEIHQKGHEPSETEREIYKSGGYKITFTTNKMIHSPDHSSMQYRVDTTETPHVIELSQSGNVVAKAIYELNGDELKLCQGRKPTNGDAPKAPASFDLSQAMPSQFPTLMILRRTKPIEPIAIPLRVAVPDAATGARDARDSGPDGKQKVTLKPKRLQIREATVVEASADSSQQSDESNIVEFSGIRLRRDPAQPAVLIEDDIMTVESLTDPNNPKASQIVLTLTPEAGERFLIETTRLSSQPKPGYLVIEFDGTVLSAPRVNDKISNKVAISASKDDDAEKLVAAIREAMEARVPDKPQAPDQPSMSKTLQQLQGKWRLTRQIAADGDESITPANTTWEFKGPRIVARDGGPGGVMLIELDESHSPVHVDVALEGADESGLGLLSIEDDKLILCLGVSQTKPELRSRPEKLQWVSGVWYMELQRVKPGETIEPETIEPVKPIPQNATATVSQTAINEAAVEALNMPSDKTSAPTAGDAAHTISGFVMEFRSGTPDVPVCLCDAATGMPVAKDTYKPIDWSKGAAGNPANEMAIVVSDSKGNFRFENVPDGKYRLIAQKWMGPYKGVFELHGAEIRLLGAVDEITVPRPADDQEARVVPTPLGENTIQFNQDVGNNETFLFLSTAPPEFDPILGLQGLGTSFWKNLIGVNRMPLGKTTVIGSPNKPVYAFMFAPDNSPGFAAITIPPPESGLVRLPAEPFVAGWSDGRKTPPPKLAELIEFMKTHELSVQQLLNIPEMSNANFKAYQARMQELTSDLSRTVDLPEGKSARVGDLLAADAYRKLEK